MREVATVLKKNNLHDTVSAIHEFCYNHFQYKSDIEEQNMRSPSCSWAVRYSGIDCKSYSIIASCLLTEMNFDHAIRKVSYTKEPESYSHVYIIVPVKNNNLENGYYIIDGTLKDNKELDYTQEKDTIMQHARLNSPFEGLYGKDEWIDNTANNLIDSVPGGGLLKQTGLIDKVTSFLKHIDLSSVSNFINGLKCLGGIGFDENSIIAGTNDINGGLNRTIASVNQSISDNDMNLFAINHARLNVFFDMAIAGVRLRHWGNFDNHCSDVNLDGLSEIYLPKLKSSIQPLYNAYVNKYFDYVNPSPISFTTHGENLLGDWWLQSAPDWTATTEKWQFSVKKGVTSIPAFEFPKELLDAVNNNQPTPDVTTMLSSLKTIISVFHPNGTKANADGTYTDSSGQQTQSDGTVIPPKQAGFGVVGWLVLTAIAIGVVKFSKGDSKQPKK